MSNLRALDSEHFEACHRRWIVDRNNWHSGIKEEDTPEEWYHRQCGACAYFIPLTGLFHSDWGACSHQKSPFDRKVMFEHDGCEEFEHSHTWVADEI